MQNLETQLESGLSGPLEQDSGEGTNYNYVVLANEASSPSALPATRC